MEAADLALLRAHEPVVRFTEGELFLPVDVGDYVRRCSLWTGDPEVGDARQLAAAGELTLDGLARAGRADRAGGSYLRFVDGPLDRAALRRWRREERPRLRGRDRLAAVGVLARVVDSGLRVSLLLRGRVPGGLAAAAELAAREHLDPVRCTYYGRVVRDAGYVVLQYWFFSVFNDWRSTFTGVNDHEADWELVCVYLPDADPDPDADAAEPPHPAWVAASCHDHAGDELRRSWDDPRLLRDGGHPVIFAGAGSHAGYFTPDDHVVTVELPVLRRVVDGVTAVWRAVAPWSRAAAPREAVALPYLDYARGDGVAVGPGQLRAWDAVAVDDATAWVRDFRGLWGLDTRDTFGGERAPAGPRYDRAGTVRPSWADPVGWAGLQKVPPRARATELAAAADLLEERVGRLDADIAAGRTQLRGLAARVGSLTGRADMREPLVACRAELGRRERELAAATAQRSRCAEELALYREHLTDPPQGGPPDAHLRRPAPAGPEPVRASRERRRLLRVWAAVSTPLLLATIVVLLVGPPLAFLTSLSVFVVAFLLVEATARGRLAVFLSGLAVTVVAVAVATALLVGLLRSWQPVLAVVLGLAAVALLAANVRELRRG
jgi:hypothetical protein